MNTNSIALYLLDSILAVIIFNKTENYKSLTEKILFNILVVLAGPISFMVAAVSLVTKK